jgi:Uma2 family endonuclease
MSAKSPIPFTYDDYKCLPESRHRYELMDGDLYVTPVPSTYHQIVSKNIQFALESHARATGCGLVLSAPVDVVLGDGPGRDVVQPDLVFIERARIDIVAEAEITGAPDLVIEILSPSTEDRDRGLKKTLYTRAAVREYWLVDTQQRSIEVLDLADAGPGASTPFELGAVLLSAVLPDLCLPLDDVFESIT